MKIRQHPEDFSVTELNRYELVPSGPFSLYRLIKWDIGTIEAVSNLTRHFKVARRDVSFGGLKDRHAHTEQVISIRGGPERSFEGSTFRVEHLGRAAQPISRDSFTGNRFRIVVRGLTSVPSVEPVVRFGIPNYFDDQRFGSLRGGSGEFIGRALVLGAYERALKLAVASPDPLDRQRERELEARMAERWGDWAALARELPPSIQRTVAEFLARRPGAFGFAFELLDRDLRVLYLEAYQSWLWNRAVAGIVRTLPETLEVEYAAGRHVFWRSLDESARKLVSDLELPYMTTTAVFEGVAAQAMAGVLAQEGVGPAQFRLRKCRNTFFGKGARRVWLLPERLSATGAEDELNPGRKKLSLAFELPRGSYATLVLKRILAPASPAGGAGPGGAIAVPLP